MSALKKKTGGKNRYMERHKSAEETPEEELEQDGDDESSEAEIVESSAAALGKKDTDPVTFGDLDAAVKTHIDPLSGQLDDMMEAIGAFQEALKGAPKTEAEIKEYGDRHLEDVHKIQEQKKSVPVFATENKATMPDFFKSIDPIMMSRKEMKQEINNIITAPTDDGTLIEYQKLCDRVKLNCELLNKKPHELEMWSEVETFLEKTGIDKVLDIAGAETNFVPEGWSMQVMGRYYQQLRVGSTFEEFPMSNGIEHFPIIGRPKAQYNAGRTASARGTAANEFTANDPDEGVTTFTARLLTVRTDVLEEYAEDTRGVLEELLNKQIPDAMAEGWERALISGSRTAAHEDNNIATATDNPTEEAIDGLRRHALLRSATYDVDEGASGAGAFDFDDFSRVAQKGGIYTTEPTDGAFVISNSVYLRIVTMTQVQTLDKFSMPTNYNGVVTWILGRPVILSQWYPENLAETGLNVASGTNNTTGFTLYNTAQFMVGNRRMDRVSQHYDPLTGFYYIVATCRKDFQSMENRRAGYTPAASAISIDLTD